VIESRFEVAVVRINLKERGHLGDPVVDGRIIIIIIIIIRWISRK